MFSNVKYKGVSGYGAKCESPMYPVNQDTWPYRIGAKCRICNEVYIPGQLVGRRCCCNCFAISWPGMSATPSAGGCHDNSGNPIPCADPASFSSSQTWITNYEKTDTCRLIAVINSICGWHYVKPYPGKLNPTDLGTAYLRYDSTTPVTSANAILSVGFGSVSGGVSLSPIGAEYKCSDFSCAGGTFSLDSHYEYGFDSVGWPSSLRVTGTPCGCAGSWIYKPVYYFSDGVAVYSWGSWPAGTNQCSPGCSITPPASLPTSPYDIYYAVCE
jgi:hypothetical protein